MIIDTNNNNNKIKNADNNNNNNNNNNNSNNNNSCSYVQRKSKPGFAFSLFLNFLLKPRLLFL